MSLAVRSSATAEDLPTASFAGQQDSYLNIKGEESLLDTCRRCFASLFTDRAIHYRIDQGFDHFKVSLSIGVMKMVRSDISSSGVMFSLDTESGFRDAVFVTGAYGLGENVVQGAVDPDEFYVHKPTFLPGHRAVLRRRLGDKAVKMILVEGETKNTTRNVPTPKADRARFCLTDDDVLELAGYACTIEQHYGRPMDMEWAKDGIDGKLYIVQARPETVASQQQRDRAGDLCARGPRRGARRRPRRSASRIASGAARRIENLAAAGGIQARRGAGRRHHHARLGAGHEDRRGDRHQPRRSHLPRVDHRPRTRHPCRGRHRRRDHVRARWRGRDGVVRRGRLGPRVPRAKWAST